MMDKRVYGVLGISAIMANWNADFSGFPKTTSDGMTYGSDKAFKYPIKKMWENEGKKVLYIKSMRFSQSEDKAKKEVKVSLVPRSLKERYDFLFPEQSLESTTDTTLVLKNLFSAADVKQFGATFAEAGNNISITGAVQIGQGFNKYEDTDPQEQQILSPFRDASVKENKPKKEDDEEAKNSTLGTKIVSNEAHYFYPFVINPQTYKEWEALGVTQGYSKDDYQLFKNGALSAATSFATNAKIGCENEFALFVETKPDLYLPNLDQYISFEKGDGQNTINISAGKFLNDLTSQIEAVEIYYNPFTTKIETDIKNVKFFNILTRCEV